MYLKTIIIIFLLDSFLPILSFLKGYFLGKYVILNNENSLYISNNYIINNYFSSKTNFIIFNKGYIFYSIYFIFYFFINTNYIKNDDANIYYLNNIYKYNQYNNTLYKWIKLGFYSGQLIYYNKNLW